MICGKLYKSLLSISVMSKKKVTLVLEDNVYSDFRKYCDDNAIMVSKKIEIFIRNFLKENIGNKRVVGKLSVFIALSLFALLVFWTALACAALFESSGTSFNQGVHHNTAYNGSALVLDFSLNGSYVSEIFNAGFVSSWDNFFWDGSYFGELPGDQFGALMDGNFLLLHMDGESGDVIDYSGEGNDASNRWASYGLDGKFGSAMGFDGTNDSLRVERIGNPEIDPEEVSIAAWVRNTGRDDNYMSEVVCREGGSNGCSYRLYLNDGTSNDNLGVQVRTSTGGLQSREWGWTGMNEEWFHFAMTFSNSDNGTMVLYYNGEDVASWNNLGVNLDHRFQYAADDLFVGGKYNGGHFSGVIDEVALWNRALSEEEIREVYSRGVLRLNLSARSCDDWLCFGEVWEDIPENRSQELSFSDSTYFQYKFDLESDDFNYTPQIYNVLIGYTILNFPPAVSLISPLDGVYSYNDSIALNFSVLDADGNIDSCWYSLNGEYFSLPDCQGIILDFPEGEHLLSVYVNDSSGGVGVDSAFFVVDLTSPALSIEYPENTNYNEEILEIVYNVSGSETCWYSLDFGDTNITSDCNGSISGLLSQEGSNIWTIYANDSAGNENFDSVVFFIDSVHPVLDLVSPNDGQIYNSNSSLPLSFLVSDTNLDSCWYSLVYNKRGIWEDYPKKEFVSLPNCTPVNLSLDYGYSYILYLFANDSSGNLGYANASFFVGASEEIPVQVVNSGGLSSGVLLSKNDAAKWELQIVKISNMVLESGEQENLLLEVKNSGRAFLNNCRIVGRGENSEWIFSEDVGGLDVGGEYSLPFRLDVPENLDSGRYSVGLEVLCKEYNDTLDFIVEILDKRAAINLVSVERESNDEVKIVYSLSELKGSDQNFEISILLLEGGVEKIAEFGGIETLPANSTKEFEISLFVPPELEGNYGLLISADSNVSSSFIQEDVLLSPVTIGGLAILDRGETDIVVSTILIVAFAVFAIFMVWRIFKFKDMRESKISSKIRKRQNKK